MLFGLNDRRRRRRRRKKAVPRAAASYARQLKILLELQIEIVYIKEVEIFPKRYCRSLWVNWLQSYKLSKLGNDPIVWESNPGHTRVVRVVPGAEFFVRPPTLTACNFAVS